MRHTSPIVVLYVVRQLSRYTAAVYFVTAVFSSNQGSLCRFITERIGLEAGLNSSIWKTVLKELNFFPATQNYMNHALLCDPFIFIIWLYLKYIRQSDRYYSICWSSVFKIFRLLKITFHNNNKLRLLSVLVQDLFIANILGKIRKWTGLTSDHGIYIGWALPLLFHSWNALIFTVGRNKIIICGEIVVINQKDVNQRLYQSSVMQLGHFEHCAFLLTIWIFQAFSLRRLFS